MKHRNLFLIAILFIAHLSSNAQSFQMPADNHFYNPQIGSFRTEISKPEAGNNAAQIQNAIDLVAKKGGGILTIKAKAKDNVYVVNTEIQIKSGVHIRVEPNVVFKTTSPKRSTLFSAGKIGNQRIRNFSLSCTDSKSYFLFDFTNRTPGSKDGGTIAVAVGGAQNFKLSDFQIDDNYSVFSCVTVNLSDPINRTHLFARDGIIEHLKATKGHYGYGLIQCQAAINVLYRNLDGEGGAALRLETGTIGEANKADRTIRIDSVYGTDINCKNGQAALTLSPHTINNGVVFIDKLTAVSCEAGAIIASGFLSAKKGQADKSGESIGGHVYGYFSSESIVSNLTVTYGTNAQLRASRRTFVPCSQRNLINAEMNSDEESYKGPTVAAIVYFAKGGTDSNKGYYTVKTPGMILKDFPMLNGKMENKEFVTSNNDGFKDCAGQSEMPARPKKNKGKATHK